MITLLRLFTLQSLKNWGLFIVAAIVLTFLIEGYQKNAGIAMSVLAPVMGFYLFLAQGQIIFSPNVSFLINLPLSKKKLILLKTCFVLFNLVLFGISVFIVAIAGFIFAKHEISLDTLNKSLSEVKTLISPSMICLAASVLFGMCTGIQYPLSQLVKNRQQISVKKRLASIIGMLILFYLFEQSKFILISSIIFFAMMFPLYQTTKVIAVSRKMQKSLMIVTFLIAVLQVSTIYSSLLSIANDAKNPDQISAIEELGPFFGGASQKTLAQILLNETTPIQSKFNLSAFYLEKFHNSKKIRNGQDPYFTFASSFTQKTCDFNCIDKMVSMFEVRDLSYQDLGPLFDKLSTLSQGGPAGSYFAQSMSASFGFLLKILPAQITLTELADLLSSNNDIKIQFALLKARYERDPSLIPMIEKNLNTYKERNQGLALKTLSILYGQHIWLDNWANYKNGRGIVAANSQFFQIDCDRFDLKNLNDIVGQNICIRQFARKKNYQNISPQAIEATDWFDLPHVLKRWTKE